MHAPRTGPTALALLVLATSRPMAAEAPAGPTLGATLPLDAVPAAAALVEGARFDVRVAVDWGEVEREPGVFDWSGVVSAVDAAGARGARVTVRLGEAQPIVPPPDGRADVPDAAWIARWTVFVRSAVKNLPATVATIELGARPERAWSAANYAFALKTAALAARSEAKAAGRTLRIAQGAIGADALAWQTQLWSADVSPYIDVLPIEVAAGSDPAPIVMSFLEGSALHPPASTLRIDVVANESGPPYEPLATAVQALGAGAPEAFAALPAEGAERDAAVRVAAHLAARLRDGWAPAPAGALRLKRPDGSPADGGAILGRFLRALDFTTLVVYRAPAGGGEPQARLVLDTADVRAPAVIDLASDAVYPTGPAEVPGESRRGLRVLVADTPMAVTWQRVSANAAGLEGAPEDVEVRTTRGLTAEEIIARHQEVHKIQDDRLLRWTAKGASALHVKLAQGGSSLDIGIESNYFGRRGLPLEWEQVAYTINGNHVAWKRIPEIPLVQPEKVATLPLDLTFDRTYTYRLLGEDDVGGRPAYVLQFDPAAAPTDRSLYRGKVFIDRETFVRLKVAAVQTGLEAPVISNDETDLYVPVVGPDGFTYWMLGRVDGQQLWTAAGRNFVVRREVAYSDFQINPPAEAFDEAVAAAYASSHQMVRDTDHGLRYLQRDEGGGRSVKETADTSQLFAAAGLLKDHSIDSVVPLAGVNWFDYDLFKKNIQVNVFFAGVFAYLNLTDPSVAGSRVDLGVESSLIALKLDDTIYVGDVEDVAQRVRRRSQYLTGRFGRPLGSFAKVSLIGDVAWNRYDDSDDARDALAAQNAADGTSLAFALPANHQVYTGTLQLEFNRRGYSVTAAGAYAHRSQWQPWGLYDTTTGAFQDATFDPGQENFATWSLTGFKEWYLPKFQKIKLEVDLLGGSDLDRFSAYQFSSFGGESLVGFSGSGVRFDQGGLAKLGWAFNLAEVIRFDVDVQHARVRDRLTGSPYEDHTGIGLSFNVVGPWTTIWQGSYGRAIFSDIPSLEGQQEFRILVLKLF